jgi:hypothetical protein
MPCLCLSAGHLQSDKALLGLVLDLSDPTLDIGAAPVNIFAEASLHALELLEHQSEVRIHGIIKLLAMRIVVGIGLHRIERI